MNYGYIDMHCDTLMKSFFAGEKFSGLREMPETMVDFSRMKSGGAAAQFFAIFLPPTRAFESRKVPIVSDKIYIERCMEIFDEEVKKNSDIIAPARSASDIEANSAAGKMSAVLTIEDGREVDGRMERLNEYKDRGVCALSLTWNSYNCFGAPNSFDATVMADGLTGFGREAVAHMQRIGIIVDVSHLSDGGFYDVAQICRKPFIATHSNCRALSPHPRNLTDDMIRTLADCGGVMGINFCPEFLEEDIQCRTSRISDMVAMAKHEKKIGGVDIIALGSDFDGIGGELELGSCDKMPDLAIALEREGFTSTEIEKIFSKNIMRVMRETLG